MASWKSTNEYCEQCKGQCWKGVHNNAETQKAAMEKFGIIPNNCVNGETGTVYCPYTK